MKKALMVGAGGWARFKWVKVVLPGFKNDIDVVGLVDIDEDVLNESGDALSVPADKRFTSASEAFARVDADFCIISTPPACHKEAVLLAAEKGMDIISEKPIADTYEDTAAIYKAVTHKSLKMAITQNYRYEPPMLTVKSVLDSGRLGRINYIVARYAHDYRKPGSWRVDKVHTRDNPLLVEASVHHFDMLRNLSGANCGTISGYAWNPEWTSFKGNCCGMFLMQMENGVKAFYEGNSLGAGQLNIWFHELYRVECEKGAVVVDHDQVVRVITRAEELQESVEVVPPVDVPLTGHHALVTEFLAWLDGGEPPVTQLSDNVHSTAMLYAALDIVANGGVKKASDYLP